MLRCRALLAATNSGPADIVTTGLVLNLDAGNPASYPGTGTTWTDLSGNGNNGTLAGIPNPSYSATNGGSLSFPHAGYVTLGDPASLRFGTGNFTIEFWLRINSLAYGGNDSITFFSKGSAVLEGFWTQQTLSTWLSGVNTFYGTNNWNINTWYHITLSKVSGVYTIYRNSISYGQVTNTSNISSTGVAWWIGGRTDGALNWDGLISIARMYNVGLTATEISQNFNALRGRYGI